MVSSGSSDASSGSSGANYKAWSIAFVRWSNAAVAASGHELEWTMKANKEESNSMRTPMRLVAAVSVSESGLRRGSCRVGRHSIVVVGQRNGAVCCAVPHASARGNKSCSNKIM